MAHHTLQEFLEPFLQGMVFPYALSRLGKQHLQGADEEVLFIGR